MWCFFNDQFVKEDQVAISVNDRGFSLGDGVFDTQLAIDGKLPDGDLHFERLLNDAGVIGITATKTLAELQTISSMLLNRNAIVTGRWVIRTQITRGIALRGLAPPDDVRPTLIMRLIPAPRVDDTPVTAIVAKTTRRNEYSPLSRVKSLNYADNLIALMEAHEMGAEEAILLNTKSNVACATTSNIFIVEKGIWTTPPLEDGVLSGITRLNLIALNTAREDHITPERLQKADEIWQCNSVIGVRKLMLLKNSA